MATSGTNYTGKWTLSDGVLNLSPLSGDSGSFRTTGYSPVGQNLTDYITLTQEEIDSVTSVLFSGSLTFYRNRSLTEQPNWVLSHIKRLHEFHNLDIIDVSGLDMSQCSDFMGMFDFDTTNRIIFPTILRGLNDINTDMADNYSFTFDCLNISSLDISNFKNMNDPNVDIIDMFRRLWYCSEIILPPDFNRKDAGISYTGEVSYRFGLARYITGLSRDDAEKNITITNENGISVSSDEDFFSLPASEQGGRWTRDLSGLVPLTFSIDGVERSGSQATIKYSYSSTSSVEVKTYLRVKGATVYPTTPISTRTLPIGTSSSSYNIELPTNDAYEIQIIADDGQTKLYSFGVAQPNILLLEIDEDGNIKPLGVFETDCAASQGFRHIVDGNNQIILPIGFYAERTDTGAKGWFGVNEDGSCLEMHDGVNDSPIISHDPSTRITAVRKIKSELEGEGTAFIHSVPAGSYGGFRAENSSNGNSVELQIGSGGTNRGVYVPGVGWMIYYDGSNTRINNFAVDTASCTIASGWANYTSGQGPLCRKQGDVVTFLWQCKPTSSKTINATRTTVCTIPAGYRPPRMVSTIQQGTGTRVFEMSVQTNGEVQVARLRNMNSTSYDTADSSFWFPLSMTWIID